MPDALTIQDLVRETGISDRTIKFYIAEGLVDGPDSPGRYATYGRRHLNRLKQIVDLTTQGFKLSAIKAKLNPQESAASYVQRSLQAMNLASMPGPEIGEQKAEPAMNAPEAKPGKESSEAWTHFRLTDGVELHCRQPLTEEMEAVIDETVAFFRDRMDGPRKGRS